MWGFVNGTKMQWLVINKNLSKHLLWGKVHDSNVFFYGYTSINGFCDGKLKTIFILFIIVCSLYADVILMKKFNVCINVLQVFFYFNLIGKINETGAVPFIISDYESDNIMHVIGGNQVYASQQEV